MNLGLATLIVPVSDLPGSCVHVFYGASVPGCGDLNSHQTSKLKASVEPSIQTLAKQEGNALGSEAARIPNRQDSTQNLRWNPYIPAV